MRIEVVYARAGLQALVVLDVGESATVEEAIRASGLLERFPEIDLAHNQVGIFSAVCGLNRRLKQGDRVEIYRPLIADPRELRRSRAARTKSG
jgi:putative ubiquitin-RnfH superfamily antitoxin RatB of RatAB toxin-antitoxin module